MRLLERSAVGGYAEAQAVLGLAYAQGQGGLPRDSATAVRWLRAAASQSHRDATFNLVAMCDALPSCLEAESSEQALSWLREASSQGMRKAAYEAGVLRMRTAGSTASRDAEALELFMHAAQDGHAGATYNAARLLYEGGEATRALVWFSRAAMQTADAKVHEITGKDDFKKTIISSQVRTATPPVPRPAHT